MTSSTPTIKAVTDGSTTKPAEHGLKTLRQREARELVSIVCAAVSATTDLTHDMHQALYRTRDTAPPIEIATWLEHALPTLESADHYLRMLDGVLAEIRSYDLGEPQTADPGQPPF